MAVLALVRVVGMVAIVLLLLHYSASLMQEDATYISISEEFPPDRIMQPPPLKFKTGAKSLRSYRMPGNI